MKRPFSVVVVDSIIVAERREDVHGVIELEQALADAVAGDVPCTVDLLGGVNAASAIVLDAEGHSARAGGILIGFMGLLVDFILAI